MSSTTWTNLLARPVMRPLIGTAVRPNHITTLRLLTGIAACVAFAWLGWLTPILVAASVGATTAMVIMGMRLRRTPVPQN